VTFLPPGIPASLRADTASLLGQRDLFVRLLRIKDKQTGELVPFEANPAQRRLWSLMDDSNRVIVLKARQVGISTAVRAWQFHRAYCAERPLNFAVLSFHDRSARNLRRMDRAWLEGLPRLLQRPLAIDSATDSIFADTRAGFSSFTTGGRGGTRSFEFSGGHLSEFAFYTDPDEVLAQSLSTVGAGPLVIESTVDAPGDAFHRLIEGAPANGWSLFTYWWWEHRPYRDEALPPDWDRTEAERQLADQYGLDDAQLWWRRQQVATLGEAKFRREYPACLDDCFLAREGGYFEQDLLEAISVIDPRQPSDPCELEAPQLGDRYVMGVDVSGGHGGDASALCVLSVATGQAVFAERSNRMSPKLWAHRVIQVASRYNNALALVESNNHGHAVLLELEACGYRHLWTRDGRPWVTTLQSKLELWDGAREALRLAQVLDRATWMELRGLTIPPGKVAPEAPTGAHDDAAMAYALAVRCLRDVPGSWRTQALQSGGRHRVDDLLRSARARRIRGAMPF